MEEDVASKISQKKAKIAQADRLRRERNDRLSDVKKLWEAAADGQLVADIRDKLDGFILMHTQMARQGVAVRSTGKRSENGEELETVFLTSEQRVAHLDQAKGIQEFLDYVDRQTTIKPQTSKTES